MLQTSRLSDKGNAVLNRTVKIMAFQILGAILANATSLAALVLLRFHLDSTATTIGTMLIASAAAGIHKSINWQEQGVDEPAEPTVPTLPMPEVPEVTPNEESVQG